MRIRALNHLINRSNLMSNRNLIKGYKNLHILHDQFNKTTQIFNRIFGFDLMILTGKYSAQFWSFFKYQQFRKNVC